MDAKHHAVTDDPMTELRRLLVEKHGVPASDVTPQARILHDLGVDGDDAAELFSDLHARFGTDFGALDRQWRMFFNTEGASPKAILIGCPALVICASASGVLAAYLHLPKVLAWVIALVLFFGGGAVFSRWFGPELRPLTVGGLAELVQAGRWPADPSNVR